MNEYCSVININIFRQAECIDVSERGTRDDGYNRVRSRST